MLPRSLPSGKRLAIENIKTVDYSKFIRNILLNWADREVGLRHPTSPVGMVIRDQGIVEMYSGPARVSLTSEGLIANISRIYGVKSDKIALNVPSIENLRFNGRSINKDIFLGRPIPSIIGDSLENIFFVGPATVTESGESLINTIPVTAILEASVLFQENSEDMLLDHNIEIFNIIDAAIKGE